MGGKGALIQEELASTLSCHNTQTLFQPVFYSKQRTDELVESECSGTLSARDYKDFGGGLVVNIDEIILNRESPERQPGESTR